MLLIKEARYPEYCGRECEFCIFDEDTDSYRCVFFGNIENEIVDEMAINREKYVNCPVIEVDEY